jgi:hypothetical protein
MAKDGLVNIRRRDALKRLATAPAAGAALVGAGAPAAADEPPRPAMTMVDPNFQEPVTPWEKILTKEERATLAVLCDTILPADDRSPAATQLGAVDFIDEWVSAPYPAHQEDQTLVRGGLGWLNTESSKRFGKDFARLSPAQRGKLCDDIAFLPRAKPAHRLGARFFDKVRNLCLSVYVTSDEGMKDLGYVGNTPMASFDGPPDAVLARLKRPRR